MARLLFIVMASALLIGLFPISNHMASMQAMNIDAATTIHMISSQSYADEENEGIDSTRSCCHAIGPFLLTCDFIASQSVYVTKYGGRERAVHSIAGLDPIYIEALTPPPKA